MIISDFNRLINSWSLKSVVNAISIIIIYKQDSIESDKFHSTKIRSWKINEAKTGPQNVGILNKCCFFYLEITQSARLRLTCQTVNDCFGWWSKWWDNIKLSTSPMYSYPLSHSLFQLIHGQLCNLSLAGSCEAGHKFYFLKSNYSVKPLYVFNVHGYFPGVNSICWPLTKFVYYACNWNRTYKCGACPFHKWH